MKFDIYKLLIFLFFEHFWNRNKFNLCQLVLHKNITLLHKKHQSKGIKSFFVYKSYLQTKQIKTINNTKLLLIQGDNALIKVSNHSNKKLYTFIIRFKEFKIYEVILVTNDLGE